METDARDKRREGELHAKAYPSGSRVEVQPLASGKVLVVVREFRKCESCVDRTPESMQ
jgi:hypothetical protein